MDLIHLLKVITAYKLTPFAKRVKEATKPLHDKIESHPFISRLIKGSLTDLEYAVYLYNMLPVYEKIERRLLCPSSVLARTKQIKTDLNKYESFLNVSLTEFYINEKWADTLETEDILKLTSVFYIRWLGDLYGGQILAKNIKFNSALKFNSVRLCIRLSRELIEHYGSQDEDKFISYVKEAYTNNYNLVDKISKLSLS